MDLQQASVMGNDIHGNGHGVDMQYCVDCLLTRNIIYQNTVTGLELEYECTGNLVYANAIGWNTESNARDDGTNNLWDDGNALGNSWSDYSGEGDYQIPGSAGSVDHFPSNATPTSSTTTTNGGNTWTWNQMTQIVTAASVVTIVIFSILIIRNRSTAYR
jgi:parallel beta-helix repeat protein